MTIDAARRWLIGASLIATGAIFVFFLVAPAVRYPLTWEQSVRVFEVVLPVFVGYLGTSTHFLFHGRTKAREVQLQDSSQILGLLIKGPIVIFGLVSVSILFAFGFSNRSGASNGEGMSVDTLSWAFTAVLGFMAVTTNVAVSYLFSLGEKETEKAIKDSNI